MSPSEAPEIELPHNAWYDGEVNIIAISLGAVTLSLTPEQFFTFAEQIEDIAVVFSQMMTVEVEECPTCGTHMSSLEVSPISDEEFN